jgi:SNF2 family DNA or RNA helicase
MLHEYQKSVVEEYKEKIKNENFRGLCLSLPMGFGKTLITLNICLNLYKNFLIICSKTLIISWIKEIEKFFGDTLKDKYKIIHDEYELDIKNFKLKNNIQFIITTPDVLKKSYTEKVKEKFIKNENKNKNCIHYNIPEIPFNDMNIGIELFHSFAWDCVIIDECQNYTNIETSNCQSIASLCSKHRLLLSGTLLQEITIQRILGLFLLLNLKYPRNIVSCKLYVSCPMFEGIDHFCIIRKENPNFKNINLDYKIINHNLNKKESICYSLLREVIIKIYDLYICELRKDDDEKDKYTIKKLNGVLLATITFIRQALITPTIAIKNLRDKIKDKTVELILEKGIEEYNLEEWLNDESYISTRIMEIIDILSIHNNEINVVFGNYLNSLEYLKNMYVSLSGEDNTFLLSGDMNIKKRKEIIDNFNNCKKGILFLTYSLGAEGLNLQHAKNVIHLDLYWNRGKEDQAVARVYRMGQLNESVNQYFIVSNTKLEQEILYKQKDKLKAIKELKNGCIKNLEITKMSIQEIVDIIDNDTNFILANYIKEIKI